MEAGRIIRFVAAFVIGIVLVTGGALIYSMALQIHPVPVAPIQKTAAAGASSGATAAMPVSVTEPPVPSPSVVRVPIPSNNLPAILPKTPPSVAYVRVPETTAVREPVLQARNATPMVLPAPPTIEPQAPNAESIPIPSNQPAMQPPPTIRPEIPSSVQPTPQRYASQPHTVTLWSGTPITVRLGELLSTDQNKSGEYFRATLLSPITQEGFVIADVGSGVTGQIVRSKRGGLLGRAPDLTLVLVQLRTTDNQIVHVLTTSWNDAGPSHNPVSGTFRSAFGAVSGALTGAVRGSGLMPEQSVEPSTNNGRSIILPPNTTLQFRLAAPVSLTEHTH